MKREFRTYGKIHRLGKEETDGVLEGTCHVQEKIDGANTQIWFDPETNWIRCGSRSKEVKEGFNGFVDYVHSHEGITRFFADHPEWRLYGEWLVRHTILYKETVYRKFYLFDVLVHEGEEERFLTAEEVKAIGEQYGIETVPMHGTFENPTVEQLQEFVGKSQFGDRGEGVVIKNLGFRNKFGDVVFAKIVTESFKEDNAVVFGGNNKHSDTYYEVYVVNKYITLTRVKKIMDKLQPQIDERLDMKHIPRICESVYHDMITEEGWAIAKDIPKLDFQALRRIAFKKSKQIYVDVLNDAVSVADRVN